MINDNKLTLKKPIKDKVDEVLNHLKKVCDASMPRRQNKNIHLPVQEVNINECIRRTRI